MPEYIVSSQAYSKAILHSAKYPWATVQGFFLAEKKDTKYRLIDAIALSHTWMQLTPMFDVALQQVQNYAQSLGLVIAGYYVANETPEAIQLSASSAQLAKTLLAINPDAVSFVIDVRKFKTGEVPALVPFVFVDAQWKEKEGAFSAKTAGFSLENNQALTTARILVEERAEVGVYDFDEHLDNVSLDWLQNIALNERIRTA
ncbi:hypothetical protein LPJ66_003063 [Kickxella alabastrina]|uniref:Uncharacterized protein n=1 Tax=Kickxella alabastrina TaxID=61397 RepID=A0ACC1IMT9_9FUNG|nr:hypothetical protein LPJ66_003063 [Kickxella alabastrina]